MLGSLRSVFRTVVVMSALAAVCAADISTPDKVVEKGLAALMKIQERIKSGEQAKRPQGEHRVGARAEGAIDRRERRLAWAEDDATRAASGLEPRGRIHFKLTEERDDPGPGSHHA